MEELIKILDALEKLFLAAGKWHGLLLGIVTIGGLLVLKALLTRPIKAYVYKRALKQENAANFMTTWKFAWFVVIAILGIIAFSGSIGALGISVGFFGMVLGWSLQAPVTGIAAWLMLILKRPFKIGQRVIIAGVKGDVVDITLTHVILNQVGGTVAGEERSGRGILIPNAILFSQTITNYTLEVEYILSEVPVRITFKSNWEEAEQILLNAAKQITADAIKATGEEPFVRAELFDAGVLMRLRYKTRPPDYAQNVNDIVKIIHAGFGKSDTVEFCYPHSEVVYSWKDQPPPTAATGNLARDA